MQKNYPNYILPKTLDLLNELKEKSGNTAPSESHLNDMKVTTISSGMSSVCCSMFIMPNCDLWATAYGDHSRASEKWESSKSI